MAGQFASSKIMLKFNTLTMGFVADINLFMKRKKNYGYFLNSDRTALSEKSYKSKKLAPRTNYHHS